MAAKKKATNGKTSNGKGHMRAVPPEADADGVITDDGPGDDDDGEDETLSVAGNALPAPVIEGGDWRAFLTMLSKLDRGGAMDVVSAQFQNMVGELKKRAKLIKGESSGVLTLTISVEADHEGQAVVGYRSEAKLPRRKGGNTAFFIGEGNTLVSQDPVNPFLPHMDDPRSKGKTFLTDGTGNVVS